MADLNRDLPFRRDTNKPQTGRKDPTPLGLFREVISNSDMLANSMALMILLAFLIGVIWAFATGSMIGFGVFFPASITIFVWAARRTRRDKRRAIADDASGRQKETKE